MRIAVVDDELLFRTQLGMMVEKLSKEMEIPFQVEAFSNGQDFIEAIGRVRYDIVFMDIYMPDMDGIATAAKLRELTERIFLIFMTASDGHYPDAFKLHAFDYVTKPFTMERIGEVLKEIISHTPMDEAFVKITAGTQEIKLYLKDICVVTTDGHYLDVHTDSDGDYRVRMTASEFLEATKGDARFATINRGIIVNIDYIETVTNTDVCLESGDSYPISTKKSAAIVKLINDYKFSHK